MTPETPAEVRARVLAETVARLEAERYAPPPTPEPTAAEVADRHAAGLDQWGDPRPATGDLLALIREAREHGRRPHSRHHLSHLRAV